MEGRSIYTAPLNAIPCYRVSTIITKVQCTRGFNTYRNNYSLCSVAFDCHAPWEQFVKVYRTVQLQVSSTMGNIMLGDVYDSICPQVAMFLLVWCSLRLCMTDNIFFASCKLTIYLVEFLRSFHLFCCMHGHFKRKSF